MANATMRDLLVDLLEDLTDRSVTESALMHELREVGKPRPHPRRAARENE